jgi:ferritin-like metal-binding protein YciE
VNEDGKLDHLREFFLLELGRALWVERRLARQVLPQLVEEVEDDELKRGLDDHRAATEEQEHNVVRVFALLGEEPAAHHSDALDGIEREHASAQERVAERSLSDLVHAAAAARTEHYELALYEELVALARSLGEPEAARLLEENRIQEERALERIRDAAHRLHGVLTAR